MEYKYLVLFLLLLISLESSSQNEVELRTDGVIIPRTQIGQVNNPVRGMIVFDTLVLHQMWYDGMDWRRIIGDDEPGLIQSLSRSGSSIILSDGGGSFTDQVNDADAQPVNELQTLSKSGSTISLSLGGGSVTDSDDWLNSGSDIYYNAGGIGIGESTPEGTLHIKEQNALTNPQLKITGDGGDAFVRIEVNREGIDKSWFHSVTTNATDEDSYYSFAYESSPGSFEFPIRMDGEERVGIGRIPAGNKLEVSGPASKTVGGVWATNSDRRIKTDIRDIKNSFELLDQLRPVKYKYTEEWKRRNPSIEDRDYLNFIAQEYQQVFPESVQGSGEYLEGDEEEILQIDGHNAQIVTIAAVKELIKENERLRKENEEMKKMITNNTKLIEERKGLHEQLKYLESRINQIGSQHGEPNSQR